jgi:hypothetical protein
MRNSSRSRYNLIRSTSTKLYDRTKERLTQEPCTTGHRLPIQAWHFSLSWETGITTRRRRGLALLASALYLPLDVRPDKRSQGELCKIE